MSDLRTSSSLRAAAGDGQVVVMHVNGLGDQLIALPTLRALDQLFPGQLALALGEGMRFMFAAGVPLRGERRVWWADHAGRQIDSARAAKDIGPCQLFISLSDWITESVWQLTRELGAQRSVGLCAPFTDPVAVPEDAHMFHRLFALAQAIEPSLRFSDFAGPPTFGRAAERAAQELARELREPGGKLLFVHPETLVQKVWPAGGYAFVLERFLAEHPEYRAVVCSRAPFPIELPAEIASRVTAAQPHLELAMALTGHADLFLGIDSCFMHAADLYRVPGVSLFGPTRPCHWGFELSPHARDVCAPDGDIKRLEADAALEALLAVADEAAAFASAGATEPRVSNSTLDESAPAGSAG